MEIITGVERRRRWSLEEKLRIVARPSSLASALLRLLGGMRSAEGCYGTGAAKSAACSAGSAAGSLLPVQTIREPANGNGAGHIEPSSARGMEQAPDGKIEITLPDGTFIKVGHDVGLVTLRRVMTVCCGDDCPAVWRSCLASDRCDGHAAWDDQSCLAGSRGAAS